ncbi:MAG: glycerol-3-phosphate dehydrogenase/oxidase [Cyclobacteriaceae bacterium]
MSDLSAMNRSQLIDRMTSEHYDLVVVGGGITGAGIALDAASRGIKTALVEKNDFASGTSSRSTKLIHGGLRYLKQFEIGLVREVGRERAIVHRLAPHLVRAEKMLIPLIKNGTFGKFSTSMGLMVYDVLAGVEKEDQRKMLSKEETLSEEPLLDASNLEGGGLYAEYRTDDSRLTIEVIKTATTFGADLINYVQVDEFLYDQGTVTGVKCADLLGSQSISLKAAYVVSAAGPWVDRLRSKDKSLEGKHLHLTKGVHLVVPHARLPLKHSVYFDVSDGRMIFAIPRNRVTYVGTTDTDYHGDINHVVTTRQDLDYLIDAVNHTFPSVDIAIDDVISNWAGLRPLINEEGKSASEISRKDEVFESDSGLISIAGGKLTGYRKMAQKVVDIVAKRLRKEQNRAFKKCMTDEIVLSGGIFDNPEAVAAYIDLIARKLEGFGFDHLQANYLVSNYGRQTDEILDKMADYQDDEPDVALARAELWYTVNNEMVHQPLDFIGRRSGRLYFDIRSVPPLIPSLFKDLAHYFNWSENEQVKAKEDLDRALFEAENFT